MTDKPGRFRHKFPRMKVGITCRINAARIALLENSGRTRFVAFDSGPDAGFSFIENCENELYRLGWKRSCLSAK
jgi:hypothetical protein